MYFDTRRLARLCERTHRCFLKKYITAIGKYNNNIVPIISIRLLASELLNLLQSILLSNNLFKFLKFILTLTTYTSGLEFFLYIYLIFIQLSLHNIITFENFTRRIISL